MKPTKMLLPLLFGSLLTHHATAGPNTGIPGRFTKTNTLHFIENKGQVVDQHHNPRTDINFKISAGNGLNIFIGAGKIHYQWSKNGETDNSGSHQPSILTPRSSSLIMYRMDVTLLNANPAAEVVTEERQSYYEQYYVTHTGPDGATAHAWRKVTYKEVYPHIDWVFRVNDQGKLEHDFIVRPGGKVSDIRLQYAGADEMQHNSDGSITAFTPFGSVMENTPYCFQENGKPVEGQFVLENNTLGFTTASHQGTLIIDPVLEWATYFGGIEKDQINKVYATGNGSIYITGSTESSNNIATTGSFQTSYNAGTDAFVAKFNQSGNCSWATYYGSSATETGFDISCDPKGDVYISGVTSGDAGIATPGSYQAVFGGGAWDAFLLKSDSAGNRIWCTYYGGEFDDYNAGDPVSVACDRWGNVYLSGCTNSAGGISTPGAHQTTKAGSAIRYDAFLVRFDTSGQRKWGTYFGGTSYEYTSAVDCDTFGNVFITGRTNSASITGIDATSHQPALSGQYDYFLAMFDSTGNVKWGTYYGGSGHEYTPVSAACDAYGHVYLTGTTASSNNISSPNSYQPTSNGGGADAFLAKFDTTGKRIWGTYYGGERDDYGAAISFDALSSIYLAGHTNSTTKITTPGSIQPSIEGRHDIFISKFDSTGQLTWATYYGGVEDENCMSASYDGMGNIYIGGLSNSITDVTTPGSHQPVQGGGIDGLLFRINDCDLPAPDTITGPLFVCRGAEATYTVNPMPGVLSYIWTLPAAWQGSSTTDGINVIVSGHTDTIRVAAEFFCGTGRQQVLAVTVSAQAAITTNASSLCADDSVLLEANTEAGMSWRWMRNGAEIPGETDSILLAQESGSYRVITTVGHCTDTSNPVIVNPLPQPVVTQDGNTLRAAAHYAAYQWYYGSQSITGANQSSYTYTTGGAYSVEVTDSNGCIGISGPFTPVHVTSFGSESDIRIYPNPARSVLYIRSNRPISCIIKSMDGREVMLTEQTDRIDISKLAGGLYLLQAVDSNGNIILAEKLITLTQ